MSKYVKNNVKNIKKRKITCPSSLYVGATEVDTGVDTGVDTRALVFGCAVDTGVVWIGTALSNTGTVMGALPMIPNSSMLFVTTNKLDMIGLTNFRIRSIANPGCTARRMVLKFTPTSMSSAFCCK